MSNDIFQEYRYTINSINSDQLTREIQTWVAQSNTETGLELALEYISTEGEILSVFFNEPIKEDQKPGLDETIARHVPQQTTESQLPEYDGNDSALAAGLRIGDFYRTGEFVKVVF